MEPKPLPQASLHEVSLHRISDFLAHSDAQPSSSISPARKPLAAQDDEMPARRSATTPLESYEIPTLAQAVFWAKAAHAADLTPRLYFEGVVAASLLRPLARRRFRIFRPAFVFMRALNP
jgi:hypothetical protein